MKTYHLSESALLANPNAPTEYVERWRASATDSRGRRQYSIHKTREEAEQSASNLKGWPWRNARVFKTLEQYFVMPTPQT